MDGKEVAELEPADTDGLFEGVVPDAKLPLDYELEVDYGDGATFRIEDPYRFTPTLGEHRPAPRRARAATRRSTPAWART